MIEPYIGLRPYQEADRDKFFGREADKRILIDKILTRKLTLLFAASGVGKSSLLQAAVIPKLKEPSGENLDVVYHNRWFDQPLLDLKNTLITYLQQQHKLSANDNIEIQLPLKEFFHQGTLFTSEPLIIVLDQFEEFFYYQHYKPEIFPIFISQLAEAILDRDTNTAFVISMREDFALELNAFKAHLSPAFLFENLYRLEKLTQASAREAMVKPLAAVGFSYEAGLLDTLITDLSQREQIERLGFSVAAKMESPDFVEPPHLQIICQQLWELEQHQPRKLITIATYISKGKADGLLKNYFLRQINQLSHREKRLASLAFNHLVNKYGTKIARPLPDLAKLLKVNEATLGATLDKLEQARILRRQVRYALTQATKDLPSTQSEPTNRILWYELYHDLFSKTIYDWNENYKTRQFFKKVAWLGTITLILIIGQDIVINAISSHLRLSLKAGISDIIEVYKGKSNSWDLVGQQSYRYETDFQRANLGIDKLFQQKQIDEEINSYQELISLLPTSEERLVAYWHNGDIDKLLCLTSRLISPVNHEVNDNTLAVLAIRRSLQSLDYLINQLHTESNLELKKQFIETLGKIPLPEHILPELLPMLSEKDIYIRQAVTKAVANLGTEAVIQPLIVLLNDPDSDIRTDAAIALGQLQATSAIEPLIALLKDPEAIVRTKAVMALGQLQATSAIELLIALLKDPLTDIRENAMTALGQWRATSAIEQLIALFKDPNGYIRGSAAAVLGQLQATSAIEPLIALLKDHDRDVRYRAATALGQLQATSAIEPLIALLKDHDWYVRYCATMALGQLQATNAIEPLIMFLKDPNDYISRPAIAVLGQLQATSTIEPLIALLKDHEWVVRLHAATVLSQLQATSAIEPLITLLKDPEEYVRSRAATALGQLQATNAIEPLITLLKDPNLDVRNSTSTALGQLQAASAIEALITQLNSSDRNISVNATKILGQWQATRAIKPLIALLKDPNGDTRSSAATALGQLQVTSAIEPLIALLKDFDNDVRAKAAAALGQLPATNAIAEPLIALLKDSEKDVRASAAKTLGQLQITRAIESLIALLKDSDKNVRANAAAALGQLQATNAIEPLIALLNSEKYVRANTDLLNDPEENVRISAVKTLGQLQATSAIEPLIALLKDSDSDVRSSATIALGQIGEPAVVKHLVKLLSDLNENVRYSAMIAINQLKDTNSELLQFKEEEFKRLQNQVNNPFTGKRQQAANHLGDFISPESVKLLVSLLHDQFNLVKEKAITSLGKIATKKVNLVQPLLTQLYPFLEDASLSIRQATIETLSQLLPQLPKTEQTDLIQHLQDIVLKQTDCFGLQVKALRVLEQLEPDQAALLVIAMAQSVLANDKQDNYLASEMFHSLGKIASPLATTFLQTQLDKLDQEKRRWRTEQRDKVTSTETNSTSCNRQAIQVNKEELWPYSQWEFELGYALTRSNTEVDIKLLPHNLALVRKGAWTALGEKSDVELLQRLNTQRDQSQLPHFRYAAYQAIDNILINLEYKGEEPQLLALRQWVTEVTDEAVRDRLQWTIKRMTYRLSQTKVVVGTQ